MVSKVNYTYKKPPMLVSVSGFLCALFSGQKCSPKYLEKSEIIITFAENRNQRATCQPQKKNCYAVD